MSAAGVGERALPIEDISTQGGDTFQTSYKPGLVRQLRGWCELTLNVHLHGIIGSSRPQLDGLLAPTRITVLFMFYVFQLVVSAHWTTLMCFWPRNSTKCIIFSVEPF